MFGYQPYASYAWGAVKLAPLAIAEFNDFIDSLDAQGVYVVELRLQKLNSTAGRGSDYAWTSKPWASSPVVIQPDPPKLLYISDLEWITEPDDPTRPNTWAYPYLSEKADIERSLPIVPGSDRRSSQQTGRIGFNNQSGELSEFIYEYSADGQLVRILYGSNRPGTRYNQLKLLSEIYGEEIVDEDGTATLSLRDASFLLDRELSNVKYTGKGGVGGDGDLAGIPYPIGFGDIFNAIPRLESREFNIFAVNRSGIEEFILLKDRGVPITVFETDAAGSWNDLALFQLTVPAGQVAFAPRIGRFCIGGTLAGDEEYRVDFKGHNLNGYVNQAGPILLEMARTLGKIQTNALDTQSYNGFKTGIISYYFNGDTSPLLSSVYSQILGPDNGVFGGLYDRRISLSQLLSPDDQNHQFELKQENIIKLTNVRNPQSVVKKFEISWDYNWGKQSVDSLAEIVDNDLRTRITRDYDVVKSNLGHVEFTHKSAQDLGVLLGYYKNKVDATTAKINMERLYGRQRKLFRLTLPRLGLKLNLGAIIKVHHSDLLSYSGHNFIIVSRRDIFSSNTVEMLIYG